MTLNLSQAFGLSGKNPATNQVLFRNYDLRMGEPKISDFPFDIFEELRTKKNINEYYPSHGDSSLREMILHEYYKKNALDNIAITHGTMGALDFIFRSHLSSDTEILLPDPGFPPYVELAKIARTKIKKYSLFLTGNHETFINWEHLESLISDKLTLVLLNSPHNPTGKIFKKKDLCYFEKILAKYPRLTFVMDEVYRGLIYGNNEHYDFSSFIERGYLVGSFSKAFPLQGARIGWVVSSSLNIKKISPYLNNAAGAMSSFGQEIAKSILSKNLSFNNIYEEALKNATEILDSFDVNYIFPESAFFIFVKYEMPDDLVVFELGELGVNVVAGSAFGSNGASYIRASFAQKSEILKNAFTIIGTHWKKSHQRKTL